MTDQSLPFKVRWIGARNRLIGNPRFQRLMERIPFTRPVARRRAEQLFDLVAGFTYTQTLYASVESGLIDLLAEGPRDITQISQATNLPEQAALRLIRAAEALDLAEQAVADRWMLGQQGAALVNNAGALAMIKHHQVLYRDLADPIELLKQNRDEETELSRFWSYAGLDAQDDQQPGTSAEYSELMAASQHLIATQVVPAYNFARHTSVLDIGGGHGVFLNSLSAAYPNLKLGLFDLPDVVGGIEGNAAISTIVQKHPGNFFRDAIPPDYDLITLIRILHDHDDAPALALLTRIRESLREGGRLLIAEPMADSPHAKKMGGAYFGLYLWAMRSGRPRSASEISSMLRIAGFAQIRRVGTDQPLIASILVATN